MLTNNRLASLPDEMVTQCRQLELIRLADNQLTCLPAGFWEMPKLAWVGLAGNPLVAMSEPLLPPRIVLPDELTIGEQLGCGGGGFVHSAVWSAQPDEPVAVKLTLTLTLTLTPTLTLTLTLALTPACRR